MQVVGRLKPSAQKGTRKSDIYKMNVFAPNKVVAKSRFWYYMSMLNRVKKANGEILQINEVTSAPVAANGRARSAARVGTRAPVRVGIRVYSSGPGDLRAKRGPGHWICGVLGRQNLPAQKHAGPAWQSWVDLHRVAGTP